MVTTYRASVTYPPFQAPSNSPIIVDDHEWRRLQRNLEDAAHGLDEKGLRALRYRGHLIRDDAVAAVKEATPKKTGKLAASTRGEILAAAGDAIAIVVTQPVTVGKGYLLSRLLTEGRKGGQIIRPRTKKALFWPGARHPVKSVRLGAMKPNDYLARAMRPIQDAAERHMKGAGQDALIQTVADLRKGL